MAKKRARTRNQDQDQDQGKFRAKNDAYTGMLTISLFALIGGCILLYLDYENYKGKPPPPPQVVSPEDSDTKDSNPFTGILEEAADPNGANPGGANPGGGVPMP
jgi:hypothetical protein